MCVKRILYFSLFAQKTHLAMFKNKTFPQYYIYLNRAQKLNCAQSTNFSYFVNIYFSEKGSEFSDHWE